LTLWNRMAKYEVIDQIGAKFEAKKEKYKEELDSFLFEKKERYYTFNDPDFPFRYASGGTLPIVHLDGEDYFCLFYREVFPIGWNIANGGCDTVEELLNPSIVIERELSEELIIVNKEKGIRDVFEGDAGKSIERPEFEVARKIWSTFFNNIDINNFKEEIVPLKWYLGPDRVTVNMIDRPQKSTDFLYLNINAEDFGIEVDRIAKIYLVDDDMVFDGELLFGGLINAPIGLFNIDRFSSKTFNNTSNIYPDWFYSNGTLHEGDSKEVTDREGKSIRYTIENKFIPHAKKYISPAELKKWYSTSPEERYRLCPVTEKIIKRYLSTRPAKKSPINNDADYKIFLSYGSDDSPLANKVYNYLVKNRGYHEYKVYMYEKDPAYDFDRQIDNALKNADAFVALGTRYQNLQRKWPEYEYRAFHKYILNEKKPKDAMLLSFVEGLSASNLPPPLCHYKVIGDEFGSEDQKLKQLDHYLQKFR